MKVANQRAKVAVLTVLLMFTSFAPTSVGSAQTPPAGRTDCTNPADDFKLFCAAFTALKQYFVDGVVIAELATAAQQGVVDASLAPRSTSPPACALPAPEFEAMCLEIDKALDTKAAALAATDAMLASVKDVQTRRLSAAAVNSFNRSIDNEVQRSGIGIEFALLDTIGSPCITPSTTCRMVIIEVYPKSSAESAGLRVGDVLVEYNEAIAGLTCPAALALDYGNSPGTTVRVKVMRDGITQEIYLTTAVVVDPVVYSEVVDNVGYLQYDQFSEMSANNFSEHLERLIFAGVDALVIDLRNNLGGYLTEAQTIASLFLKQNDLIFRISSAHGSDEEFAQHDGIAAADEEQLPVVVVVNGLSASASEVVVNALRGHGRAKIVGTTTFGKFTGQITEEVDADDGSLLGAIQVTSIRLFGPNNLSARDGIEPDILLPISDCLHPIGVVREAVVALSADPVANESEPIPGEPEPIAAQPAPVVEQLDSINNEPEPIPADEYFDDIANTSFADAINWLAQQGITTGCDTNRFCPNQPLTRAQMAAFLSRTLKLAPTPQDYFTDDNTSTFHDHINRLRESQITTGCDTNRFCPNQPVTRAQMAAFLSRTLKLAPTPQDYFTDDNTSAFHDHINRLRESQITTGCDTNRFCPNQPVTRAQMAAFLYRARLQLAATHQQLT